MLKSYSFFYEFILSAAKNSIRLYKDILINKYYMLSKFPIKVSILIIYLIAATHLSAEVWKKVYTDFNNSDKIDKNSNTYIIKVPPGQQIKSISVSFKNQYLNDHVRIYLIQNRDPFSGYLPLGFFYPIAFQEPLNAEKNHQEGSRNPGYTYLPASNKFRIYSDYAFYYSVKRYFKDRKKQALDINDNKYMVNLKEWYSPQYDDYFSRSSFKDIREIRIGRHDNMKEITVEYFKVYHPTLNNILDQKYYDKTKKINLQRCTIIPFEGSDDRNTRESIYAQAAFIEQLKSLFPGIDIIDRKNYSVFQFEQDFFTNKETNLAASADVYFYGYVPKAGVLHLYYYNIKDNSRYLYKFYNNDFLNLKKIFQFRKSTKTNITYEESPIFSILKIHNINNEALHRNNSEMLTAYISLILQENYSIVDRENLSEIFDETWLLDNFQPLTATYFIDGWYAINQDDTYSIYLKLIRSADGKVIKHIQGDIPYKKPLPAFRKILHELISDIPAGYTMTSHMPPTKEEKQNESLLLLIQALDASKKGFYEKALSFTMSSLKMNRSYIPAISFAIKLCFYLKKIDLIESIIEPILSREVWHPDYANLLYAYAGKLYENKQPQACLNLLKRYLDVYENTYRRSLILYICAKIALENKDYNTAYRFANAVNATPLSTKWFYEPVTYIEKAASNLVDKIKKKYPITFETPIEKRIKTLKNIVSRDPTLFQAYYQIGRMALRRMGDKATAAWAFEKCIEQQPGYAEAWKEFGFCNPSSEKIFALYKKLQNQNLDMGEFPGTPFNVAAQLKPFRPLYQNDIGEVEKAIELRQHRHDFYSTLALLSFILKQYMHYNNMTEEKYSDSLNNEQKNKLRRAIELLSQLQPDRTNYRALMAYLYLNKLKDTAKAFYNYSYLLEKNPTLNDFNNNIDNIKDCLQKLGRSNDLWDYISYIKIIPTKISQARTALKKKDFRKSFTLSKEVLDYSKKWNLWSSFQALQILISSARRGGFEKEVAPIINRYWRNIKNNPFWLEDQGRLLSLAYPYRSIRKINSYTGADYSLSIIYEHFLKEMTAQAYPVKDYNFKIDLFKDYVRKDFKEKSIPIFSIKRINEPVTCDGKLQEPFWKDARHNIDFVKFEKSEPQIKKTVFYSGYDDTNIYFAFECFEYPGRPVMAYQTDTNAPIYYEDGILLQIDEGRTMQRYRELRISALGISRTITRGPFTKYTGESWSPDYEYGFQKYDNKWVVEISINRTVWDENYGSRKAFRMNPCRIWYEPDIIFISPIKNANDVANPEDFPLFIFE